MRIFWVRSAGCFIYSFVVQVIIEKTLCNKGFTCSLRDILHENIRNYNSYRLVANSLLSLFLPFLTKQKKESGFQQVGGLVTKNISVFLFIKSRALLQSHAKFNKLFIGIFLHVTPVSIIVHVSIWWENWSLIGWFCCCLLCLSKKDSRMCHQLHEKRSSSNEMAQVVYLKLRFLH